MTTPLLRDRTGGDRDATVTGVVLLLPGGTATGTGTPSELSEWYLRPLATQIAAAAGATAAVHLLRYRHRGWNSADPVADTRWALDELRDRHGDVPVTLVGNSMGGRAAVHAADHPAVTALVLLAPWLPPDGPVATVPTLIVHGGDDHTAADVALSRAYAVRARAVTDVARFVLPGDGHPMTRHRAAWYALVAESTAAAATGRPPPAAVRAAHTADLDTPIPASPEGAVG